MVTGHIEYRKATDNDVTLTYSIKQSSIKHLVEKIWGWDNNFQIDYHRKSFVPNKTQIIIYGSSEVGFFVVNEYPGKVFIENILIDPAFQGKGIGTKVLTDIMTGAANKKVELQVFKINNRAKQLYDRLGFETYEQTNLHYKMRK
ncbi:MAG: GNAT family N-acetyltransferase [Agriterribacter sp.]